MQIDTPVTPRRRLSMTPLIDVVFLLLVFFMLASTFLQYSRIDVTGSRPGASSRHVSGSQYVRVHAGGRLDLNGVPVALEDLAAKLDRNAGEDGSRVILRPVADANVQHLVTVMEAVKHARITELIVAR